MTVSAEPDLLYTGIKYFSYSILGIFFILFILSRIRKEALKFFRNSFGVVSVMSVLVALLLAILFASVKGCGDGKGDGSVKGENKNDSSQGGIGSNVPQKIEVHSTPSGGYMDLFYGTDEKQSIQIKAGWEDLLYEVMGTNSNQSGVEVELWSESSVPRAARGMIIDRVENLGFIVIEVDE